MTRTFVWSDLHVNHVTLAEKWRPWAGGNVPAHTETLRDRWNAVVGPKDRVVIVGDAVMGKRVDSIPVLASFNGHKELVPGNHDKMHPAETGGREDRWLQAIDLYSSAFHRIWGPGPISGDDLFGIPGTIVCHFPWLGTPDHEGSERGHYERWMPDPNSYTPDTVLIHGHTHRTERVSHRAIHVGVDAWPEGPVSLDEIRSLLPHARAWI